MSRMILRIVCVALKTLIPMAAYGASTERGAISVERRWYFTKLHMLTAATNGKGWQANPAGGEALLCDTC